MITQTMNCESITSSAVVLISKDKNHFMKIITAIKTKLEENEFLKKI